MIAQELSTSATHFPAHNEKVTSVLQLPQMTVYEQKEGPKSTNKKKPERRPRQQNAAPQPPSTLLNHKNDHVAYQIERGLIKTKEYKMIKTTNQLRYKHEFEAPDSLGLGEITILISGLTEQTPEYIEQVLKTLGTACRDTLTILTDYCFRTKGTNNMRAAFKVSTDYILQARGIQPSHRAYTPEQRAEVIKHIKTLSQASITFLMPIRKRVKRGKRWEWEDSKLLVEGPLISYNGKIGEYSSITGEAFWELQDISLGQWAEFFGNRVQTNLLPQDLLAYSSKHEPYHKLLGYFIHRLFRNNAHRTKGVMPYGITMRAFFEGSFIEPPRERGKFKEDIDKALKHLKEQGVIKDYWYMKDKNPPEALKRIEAREGRWFEQYLDLFINFSPTDATLEHYRNIVKKEDIAEEQEKER
jgi:hypothetical protein